MDIERDPLAGEQVRLASLSKDDVATVVAWYQNGQFLRMMDSAPAAPRTSDAIRTLFFVDRDEVDTFTFGVRTIAEDDLVGFVSLGDLEWSNAVGWLAIGIDPSHQGEGYGGEAMELALNFAFDELALHRVQLTVFAYNDPAIALYERLGFVHEGTYREFLKRDGERHDMHLYGMLAEEWAKQRTAVGHLAD